MRILFNNFKRAYEANKRSLDKAIGRVCKSGRYILGDEVTQFEKNFAAYHKSRHAIGVANGLEALQIALMALGIKEGDEVITTSYSAVATALSIRAVGAKPIFVDVDEYFHIDTNKIEAAITSKTRAILPVHIFGQAAPMDTIMAIARKHNLAVIEDCAQAHGAEYKGKKMGTVGDVGCFSFYPTKNLGGFGDGGALITDSDRIAELSRMIRNYGQQNRYEHEIYGINSRLDELQAAILNAFLPNLDTHNERRRAIASLYAENLSDIASLQLPKERRHAVPIYHLYVIETEKRNELQKYLDTHGVASLIHYPIPIHKQKCFSEWNSLSLPHTEKKADHALSLPVHPYLTDKEVLYICKQVRNFFNQ